MADALLVAVAVAASREKCGLEGRMVSHRMMANKSSDTAVDDAAISARRRPLLPLLPPPW
uniref:Uncharacterized protein n=1 Tax=Arundo donax TaxID=35708 RepID=A0A0A8ZXG6_ARUDO